MTTLHMRKAPVRRSANRPEPEFTQIRRFLFRHRDDLKPFYVALVVLLIALIVETYPYGGLVALLGYAGLGALLLWQGQRLLGLDRAEERAYAAACAAVAGLWTAWFTLGDVQPLAALPLVTTIMAIPWWRHRRVRAMVPVTITGLSGMARRRAEQYAARIIAEWERISRQGKIRGAVLKRLMFDPTSMTADITLRGGQSIYSLNYESVRASITSAFDAPDGSLRITGSKRARDVTLRFLLVDPLEEPMGPPPPGPELVIGRFETGEPVIFDDQVHTGVFGRTGAGKSGVVNLIIQKLRLRPDWALIGVDLKPGAPELGKWGRTWFYLADTPERARFALEALIQGFTWRGQVMRRRGWRTWRATPEEPIVALVVDEVQELRDHGLMRHLERVAGLGRAYGFRLIVATQHPVDKNLPSTVYNQLGQIIGLKVQDKADRVVFGENANREGWTPSKLRDRPGMFLIRNSRHRDPVPARSYYLSDDDVDRESATGPGPTLVDPVTARAWVEAGEYPVELGAADVPALGDGPGEADEAAPDVVEADVVTPDGRTRVLDAIRDGIGTPADIAAVTGIPKRTVVYHIRALADAGLIVQDGPRRPWRAAA